VAPNRLARAKAEIRDLLSYLEGTQVGLIAFAGRASVVAPLTPDFGFLRLVLDSAGPQTIRRGGTRLEEPIRKAIAGFGDAGDLARILLLITDGEDHDSFALDAAAAAAERGVKIIAIGFGDENGSEIYITDRRTGARVLVTDSNGQAVLSRLDGALLRDIALTTDGAYVPAGTGLLDLESIYEQHIGRLTRSQLSERDRVVRDEVYQWAVLLGLIFLVSSVVVSGVRFDDRITSRGLLLLFVLVPLLGSAPSAQAQPSPDPVPLALEAEPEAQENDGPSEAPPPPLDPREVYNAGIASLDTTQLEDAEHSFRNARRDAKGDAELRFHTTYNLGWTLAERASLLQESDPGQALRFLYEAADWYREAIRVRPEDDDARHNLEVVLNRALLLADAMAKRGNENLSERLEKLATDQRVAAGGVAALLERVSGEEGPHVSESLRALFREAANSQRTLLSDADELAKRFGEELEGISATPEEERAPEDQMRTVQLDNVMHYMHRARERMGQARQQLRRREAPRAYRRSSSALAELKRAQDQLKDPLAVLDRVIENATEIATYTAGYAAATGQLLTTGAPSLPKWLTPEYLFEEQATTAERAAELHLRLQVGDAEEPAEPAAARQFAAVRAAEPFVAVGQEALLDAANAIDTANFQEAMQAQRRGVEALQEARERFLDLRGLLETLYADEKQVLDLLSSTDEEVRRVLREFLPPLRTAKQRGLDRADRLRALIDSEEDALRNPPSPANGEEVDPEQQKAELERLDAAVTLLELARGEMNDALAGLGEAEGDDADFETAALHTEQAVKYLSSLRRLFFSIIELVRDIAERQLEVADATQDLATLEDGDVAVEKLGPLIPRQKNLSKRTEAIALELEKQSREQEPDPNQDPATTEDAITRLRLAAESLLFAEESMRLTLTSFEADPPGFEAARADQENALIELSKALEQLTPPQQQQQPEPGEDEQGDGQQEQQQQEEQEEGQDGTQGMDPQQLLQGVRDREAERREEQDRKAPSGYETVEKDW